jgi:hypothetical protein
MKKKFLTLVISVLLTASAFAQVGINSDNSEPDSAAILDVRSVTKGFLPPRMTNAQMTGIVSPPEGLLVYNLTDSSLYWFNGALWKKFNDSWFTETDPVFAIHPSSSVTSPEMEHWDTAFSWGNHSLAGYLTDVNESDPLFLPHPSMGISATSIDHWNEAYNLRITAASGTPPLSLTLNANQLTGSILQAGATSSGYITSVDWNTFNNKQNALTFGDIVSQDMTVTGGVSAVTGGGVNLTINKGNLTSTDMTITGGTGAVLGTGTAITVKKGNLTESVSSVLNISGGSGAVLGTGTTIRVKQSSPSQSGYVSSADWNTFNSKQNALTIGNLSSPDILITGGTGAVQGSGTVLSIPKGNLTSPDILITGGSGAVLGSGTTLNLNKGNLTESGSEVLTITNGNGAVLGNGTTIQMKQAGTSQSGYVSTSDWNTFNNKLSGQWSTNGNTIHYSSGGVGVGTSNPDNSAKLELSSTAKGFLPPRLTAAQRDAIQNPASGLIIYCLDCPAPNNLQIFFGSSWYPLPYNRSPYATSVAQSDGPFIQNILTGFYIYHDDDNDPEGNSLFQWYRADDSTGLNEAAILGATGATYTLTTPDLGKYVRFSVTPVSLSGTLKGTRVKSPSYVGAVSAFACGLTSLTINHNTSNGVAPVNKSTTYGTVTNVPGEPGKCWITQNLGAGLQAASVDDNTEPPAGWYWQFNRKQGFKHDGTTITPAWNSTTINENSEWSPAEDPCSIELGSPWRIPSKTEWNNLSVAGNWFDWNGPWNSLLKLHAAGFINTSGILSNRGIFGHYQTSTQSNNSLSWFMSFYSSYCSFVYDSKNMGNSVRCVR